MTSHLTWGAAPFLLLLVPLVLLAVVVWRLPAARTAGQTALFGLRCIGLALLIVALAQPVLSTADARPVVFVADNSASMTGASHAREIAWLQQALRALPSGTSRRLVTFAAQPALSSLPGEPGVFSLGAPSASQGTNIESALRLALAAAPSGSRLVVLSDGVQTSGDALAVAPEAYVRHLPIDVVPVAGQQGVDAALTRFQVSPTVRQGGSVPLLITVRSTIAAKASLALEQDGRSIGREAVILRAGDNPFVLNVQAPTGLGWHAYRAVISLQGDSIPQNNVLDATTLVTAQARVLLVTVRHRDPFAPILRRSGAIVQTVTAKRFPASLRDLLAYGAVVLDDIPAADLNKQQVVGLDRAVRSAGLGLLVLGGTHSLTLGHYSLTPLERMLPVVSVPPSTLHQGNIGLQLIMDRSGSMNNLAGQESKISMSQAAANIAVDFAQQHKDDLGVVSFDITPHTLVPLQKFTTPAAAAHAHKVINAMTADGGTNIYAALQSGLKQILLSNAPFRHMILMTDGVSNPANYDQLLSQIAKSHITLSTVALGQDADTKLLKAFARIGRGRFYYTANASDLPHIFAKEVRLSAGAPKVAGTIPAAVSTSSTVLRDLPLGTLPAVHGYPATTLKPGAVAPLVAHAQARGADPLLAQWQYGLGRVLVWTPGVTSNWVGSWLQPRSGLWNNLVQWMLRGVPTEPLTPQIVGNSVRIDTFQTAGTLLNLSNLVGSATTPTGKQVDFNFQQLGPGEYSAPLAAQQPGIYRVEVRQLSSPFRTASAAVTVPYSAEYSLRRPDLPVLTVLASRTGGDVLRSPHQLRQEAGAGQRNELWWPLACLALLLFFLDISLRLAGMTSSRT